MKFRPASSLFFCAAALIFPATAFAEETVIYNLSGDEAQPIASGNTLVVNQQIDGVFTGTLGGDGDDGAGSFIKKGEADLTLDGTVALASGAVTISEGSLTLGSNVVLPGSEFYVTNTGTLVLASGDDSGALEQLVVTDSNRVGTITNIASGTTSVSSLSGNLLNVNAGTLVVGGGTHFNTISVLSGATLQIGTGTASSLASLSGDVALEKNAALIFNRKATTSADDIRYSGKISGEGEVIFNGTSVVYFTGGNDQTYTGTTAVNAGGMVFNRATQTGDDGNEYYDPDAQAALLASPEITVAPGAQFGGHVTASGNVTVNGTDFSSYSDWESKIGKDTFGSWYAGAGTLYAPGGSVLTIEGDLKIAPTEVRYYFPTEDSYDLEGNSGGALRVDVNALGAGKVVAAGNAELGGTLILVGADGLETGNRYVIFESDPEKTTGAFDSVVYGSDNVTLLLPGVGGIKENQYGAATVESRNVRKRAAFDEHDGLGEFVDYLVSQADGMNKVAQAVSLADGESVTDAVNNFSALPYCAFAETAIRQSESELNMILLNIARARLTPPNSPDGVTVPANFTFFSGLLTDFVNHESEEDTPVYDFNSVGAFAGGYKWLDDERMAGVTLGMHRSSAQPHGADGELEDIAVRAKIFAVFTPKFSDWFLTVGGTLGVHHYDINRGTELGKNSGSTNGIDAGLFAALNYRAEIEKDLFLTPYLRFEYNFSYVGGLEESGTASRLDIDHILYNNYRILIGSGVEYTAEEGKTFGVDVGLTASLGQDPKIYSSFAEYENSRTKIKGTVGETLTLDVAPRMSFRLGDDWTADTVYRLQCSFEGSLSHSFGIGLSKQF